MQAFKKDTARPWINRTATGLAIALQAEAPPVVELLTPIADDASNRSDDGDDSLAELLLELGNAHHALGEKDQALQRWREGTHGAEGEKRLFIGLNIAQVLCGDRQFQEAFKLCKELETLFPKNANLVYAQGVIAKGTGDLGQAAQLFERALELNPHTRSASTPTGFCCGTSAVPTNLDTALNKLCSTTQHLAQQ